MTSYSLSLIVKEQESLPRCIEKLAFNSKDRLPHYSTFTFSLSKEEEAELRTQLLGEKIDFFLLPTEEKKVKPKLVVFDMDSTLIQNEVIDEMANLFGKGKEVHEITERAMNGELDFDGALKARVALLRGLNEKQLTDVLKVLKVTEGIPELIQAFKKQGIKSAVVSGGFQIFANHFKNLLGLDYAYANELEFHNGFLTGEIHGEIVNGNRKAVLLEEMARKEGFSLRETVSIGDGANDIPMLKTAGKGIAYRAKEKVKQEVHHQVNFGTMEVIGYYLDLE